MASLSKQQDQRMDTLCSQTFDRLAPGFVDQVEVMVCLKWEAKTSLGEYINTEYLLSDNKGNIIQCSSSSDISPSISPMLEEGIVYRITNLIATPNNDRHRVRRDNDLILLLRPSTTVTALECSYNGFMRYPFQFTPFEEVTYVDDKYLIDVIGRVTTIGNLRTRLERCKFIDCEIMNERGKRLKATVWGPTYADFQKITASETMQPVIFTAMTIQQLNGEIYLATTLDTTVRNALNYTDLPGLHSTMPRFHRNRFLNYHGLQRQPNHFEAINGTVADLLSWSSRHKKPIYFNCTVIISKVEVTRGWYHCLCPNPSCKRALLKIENTYWCEKCESLAETPDIRFKIRVDARDDTGNVTLNVFDDTVQKMCRKSAVQLAHEKQEGGTLYGAPKCLQDLTLTTHTMQINTCTYYPSAASVEFVCSDVFDHTSQPSVSVVAI